MLASASEALLLLPGASGVGEERLLLFWGDSKALAFLCGLCKRLPTYTNDRVGQPEGGSSSLQDKKSVHTCIYKIDLNIHWVCFGSSALECLYVARLQKKAEKLFSYSRQHLLTRRRRQPCCAVFR